MTLTGLHGANFRGPHWRARCVFAWLALVLQASPTRAETGRAPCDVPNVTVHAALDLDAADACLGAQAAIRFFLALGLKADAPISIRVQEPMPPQVDPSAAGCFLERDGRVLMRPYASFRKNRTWFKVAIDRRLYRSVAAHEVAHAVAACNFSVPHPTIQAKEYLAYVAMFETMEPALRERILRANPEPQAMGADRLTALLYLFDPMRFGLASYRHHLQPSAREPFLRDVLSGRALTD